MPTIYVACAFSLHMLDREQQADPTTARAPRPIDDPQDLIRAAKREGNWDIESIIGRWPESREFSRFLGVRLPVCRTDITIGGEDILLIGAYRGAFIEGETEISWWQV